jgi:predicted DNA-binding protein
MTRKTETLIRLTASTKQRLAELAQNQELSLSNMVEKLILEYKGEK